VLKDYVCVRTCWSSAFGGPHESNESKRLRAILHAVFLSRPEQASTRLNVVTVAGNPEAFTVELLKVLQMRELQLIHSFLMLTAKVHDGTCVVLSVSITCVFAWLLTESRIYHAVPGPSCEIRHVNDT
jgi:hypothetical protein